MTRPMKLSVLFGLFAALVLPVAPAAVTSVDAAGVTSMSIRWALPSGQFGIGIGVAPGSGGYSSYYEYPQSICGNNRVMPNPVTVTNSRPIKQVRLEIYKVIPKGCGKTTVSGIALRLSPAASRNVGTLRFPTDGQANTGRFVLKLSSSTPLTPSRLHFSMFQQSNQPLSNTGQPMDAFTAGGTGDPSTATNPLWNGRYVVFLLDKTTGRKATGLVMLKGETILNVDLDAPCFGIDECVITGGIAPAAGTFHPLPATRIVDTKVGLGIKGAVTPGDGRSTNGDVAVRLATRKNHEFVVVNRGGVPLAGVSAVLANVTVAAGPSKGALRAFPKPPRTSLFAEQSSFPAKNTQSPVLYFGAGDVRSSTQLLKVGVGGRVRLENTSFASAHVTVDVLGWFDSSQPGQAGQRVVAVSPTPAVDTRVGLGTTAAAIVGGESRVTQVRDGVVVPAGAGSVFGVLTTVGATTRSGGVAWQNGAPKPSGITHVSSPSSTRVNLVNAATDAGGAWTIFQRTGASHVTVDVAGYSIADGGTGGVVRPVASTRVLASAAQTPSAVRRIPAAAGAVAAFVLVTANGPYNGGAAKVYPTGGTPPTGAQVQWTKGTPSASLVLVPVGADGTITLEVSAPAVTTVDVLGWVN